MSVHINGVGSSPPSVNENSVVPHKKRKHEGKDRESSAKKKQRRQNKTLDERVVTENGSTSANVTQEKTEKKRKQSSKEVEAREQEGATTVYEDVLPDAPLVDEAETPERSDGQQPEGYVLDGETESVIPEELLYPDLLDSQEPSSFYTTRISLHVSIPAISLSSAKSSLLSKHLAPLLLSYFPPAEGIVLGFSDPALSAKPSIGVNLPLIPPDDIDSESQTQQEEVFTRTADEYGICWVWLTATLLVFRPEKADMLKGWTNVTSEGFVGLVSYNYFQTSVVKNRIPEDWIWNGPTKEQFQRKKARKGRLRDEMDLASSPDHAMINGDSQATAVESQDEDLGYFVNKNGQSIPKSLAFRVVDTEMVPGSDRGQLSMQIYGSLLDEEAEAQAMEEDRERFERTQQRGKSKTPGMDTSMSGALGRSREPSVIS